MTNLINDDFLWTVEEACINAHPSPRDLLMGGWLLRAAGGPTRRANSLNPLRCGPRDPGPILPHVENIYGGLGQVAYVRVPSIAAEMDLSLARAGYVQEGETTTLQATLSVMQAEAPDGVDLRTSFDEPWWRAWCALNPGLAGSAYAAYHASLSALALPALFACRFVDGQPASLAYGVLDRGILVVESVRTHADHRRRGHAATVVAALLHWGAGQGASSACLQVQADNHAAIGLYRGLGFDRELYRYHYRRKPDVDAEQSMS